MCTNQDISNIPFIMMGNHFLVHGHKKDLPHITCIFHLLKYVVKMFLVSAILHHISVLRLLPKSYFKISTFQPNFLCSSSFKRDYEYVLLQTDRNIFKKNLRLVLKSACLIETLNVAGLKLRDSKVTKA